MNRNVLKRKEKITEYEDDKMFIKEHRHFAERECHKSFPQSLFFWIFVISKIPPLAFRASLSPKSFCFFYRNVIILEVL
jgi:hypothetical protein